MRSQQFVKTAGAFGTLGAIVMGGMLIRFPHVHADDDDPDATVQIGFQIAPVRLNLAGRPGAGGIRGLSRQRRLACNV
jgi:hypothetical protein